jgi:hypothetical protein
MSDLERRLGKIESRVADDSSELAELTALLAPDESPEEIRGILESLKRNGMTVADWIADVDEVIAELEAEPERTTPYDADWGKRFVGHDSYMPVEGLLPDDEGWRDEERRTASKDQI